MKHILMIAYTMYSTDGRIKREAEALANKNGYRVMLFTTRESTKARTYKLRGVRVRESCLPKYRGNSLVLYVFSYLIFTFLCFWFCFTRLFKHQLDVVHVHNMPNFLVFGALPIKLRGGKIVLDVHDTMVETYATKFQESGKNLLLKLLELEESVCTGLADAVIAVNEPQAEVLIKRGIPKEKITIVMNVPDDRLFDYGSQVIERERQTTFRTVYHGTVTKRNGVDLAIRAVVGLKTSIPEIEMAICGSGDYIKECETLVERLDAGHFISFKKKIPIENIGGFLKGMDLEIVTNQWTPASELMLPVKLMECVALGLPVVIARLPTIEKYFSDDMVYFYEPENLKSLSEAISQACGDREGRIQKARRAKDFLKKYGWETQKKNLFYIYQIIGKGR